MKTQAPLKIDVKSYALLKINTKTEVLPKTKTKNKNKNKNKNKTKTKTTTKAKTDAIAPTSKLSFLMFPTLFPPISRGP
ncbi:hypothetical protein SAMD00023353_1502120 [Rosellinia necatrix]|uniref:Uncharacterized protein n=1 Tax=Rosellinia necatrix TaxID=77044 RepID=A0A1W2TRD9_ROSNE|nr:hypothetical protein SAMD00023353_1502120 [Rosellinia necatrix]